MKELTLQTLASKGQRHSIDKGIITVMASAAVIGVVFVLAHTSHEFLYVLSNGLPPSLAFAAFAMAAAGLLRNGVNVRDRVSSVWVGYSLGVLFWFFGEFAWAVYALWYSTPIPFPSLADGFWLVGYVPLLCAIAMQSWPFHQFLTSRKMLPVILAVFVLAGLLLVALIPPTFSSEIGLDFVTVVLSLAYPLLDVALLVIALPVLFLFGKGTFWRPFLFVTVGLILTFLGDILFSWTTLNGTYYDGSYLELLFHWSYLTLAYGFYLRFKSGTGAKMLE
jgi:hypothetical protein